MGHVASDSPALHGERQLFADAFGFVVLDEPVVDWAAADGRVIGSFLGGQFLAETGNDLGEFGIPGEIGPFVGVRIVVVELFGAIVVSNVSILLGSKRVIAAGVGCQYGVTPGSVWVFEKRG